MTAIASPALAWTTNATGTTADADIGGHSVYVTLREDGAWQFGGDLGYSILPLPANDITGAQREAEAILRRGLLRMLAQLR